MNEIIINPLVAHYQFNINDINNIDELYKKYTNVYVLTIKENIQYIDESIYNYSINKELYDDISKNLILLKTSFLLLKIPTHYNKTMILSKTVLEKFNVNNYCLEDKNLVLLILNISYENIKLYLLQFEKVNTLDDIYKTLIINEYMNNDINYKIRESLNKNILNLHESFYWTYPYNCYPDLSKYFKNRLIIPNYLKECNEYDYLKNIFNNNNNNNSIKMLLTLKYKYKINTNSIFTKDEIYNLIMLLPDKERFLLFCNLIISKAYCHLALNNEKLLLFMKPIINKYIQLFRYLIGYAWVKFYFDESVKDINMTKDDLFVFNINTASLLPIFPFYMSQPKMNPYCVILINDNALNSKYNIGGIFNNNISIANLDEFKSNLNIFLTGNKTHDLLENIDYKTLNIALCGSVICACIQKYNPLMALFDGFTEDKKLKRYYDEYYANADIDIMFLCDDIFNFFDHVKIFYDQIVINVCKLNTDANPSDVKLICNKFAYLFVTMDDINEIISQNLDLHLNYTYILNNFENPEIKKLFLNMINVHLEKYKNNFFNNLSEDQIKTYTQNYENYVNFDNFEFKIRMAKNKNDTMFDDYNEKNKIAISYKYKIKSQYIDCPFELFMVKYNFMSMVQKFHLPCVRSYYDGFDVYMTPSCISAHLTGMNIDYRYFAGTISPMEIINKYRMRGFGTWLNESEKVYFLKYSKKNTKWNNLYCINNSEKSLISNLGLLKIDHKIFRPRLFNFDEYINCKSVDLQYYLNISINNNDMSTNQDYINELDKIYNNKNNPQISGILGNLQTINIYGTINPIHKWTIETIWEIYNLNNLNEDTKTHLKPLKYKI